MTSLDHMWQIILFGCDGLAVYHYMLYPLVIWCCARCFGRRRPPAPVAGEALPSVSVVVSAYNERGHIGRRIRNALAIEYPSEKIEIVVGSDGSDDGTNDIVRDCADERVRLLAFPRRQGKASVLNAIIPHLKHDVVIFSDANTLFDPTAVLMLVRWMRDPGVVAVCGRLVLTDPATGKNVDSLYWRYETFLKKCEGALGALLGSNGAIYALRREDYVPIPPGTIVDDFVIPLRAKLRRGGRVVYDNQAVAREESAPTLRGEFDRRSRIGAGGFQAIGLLWKLLNPLRGWVAFTFISHKVLRWICPFALIGMLVSNLFLLHLPVYRWIMGMQLTFYGCSVVAAYLPASIRVPRVLRLTSMFTGMNLALLMGFFRWMSNRQSGAWSRTVRVEEWAGNA